MRVYHAGFLRWRKNRKQMEEHIFIYTIYLYSVCIYYMSTFIHISIREKSPTLHAASSSSVVTSLSPTRLMGVVAGWRLAEQQWAPLVVEFWFWHSKLIPYLGHVVVFYDSLACTRHKPQSSEACLVTGHIGTWDSDRSPTLHGNQTAW